MIQWSLKWDQGNQPGWAGEQIKDGRSREAQVSRRSPCGEGEYHHQSRFSVLVCVWPPALLMCFGQVNMAAPKTWVMRDVDLYKAVTEICCRAEHGCTDGFSKSVSLNHITVYWQRRNTQLSVTVWHWGGSELLSLWSLSKSRCDSETPAHSQVCLCHSYIQLSSSLHNPFAGTRASRINCHHRGCIGFLLFRLRWLSWTEVAGMSHSWLDLQERDLKCG